MWFKKCAYCEKSIWFKAIEINCTNKKCTVYEAHESCIEFVNEKKTHRCICGRFVSWLSTPTGVPS